MPSQPSWVAALEPAVEVLRGQRGERIAKPLRLPALPPVQAADFGPDRGAIVEVVPPVRRISGLLPAAVPQEIVGGRETLRGSAQLRHFRRPAAARHAFRVVRIVATETENAAWPAAGRHASFAHFDPPFRRIPVSDVDARIPHDAEAWRQTGDEVQPTLFIVRLLLPRRAGTLTPSATATRRARASLSGDARSSAIPCPSHPGTGHGLGPRSADRGVWRGICGGQCLMQWHSKAGFSGSMQNDLRLGRDGARPRGPVHTLVLVGGF